MLRFDQLPPSRWFYRRYGSFKKDLNLLSVPCLYENLYREVIGDFVMMYSPISYKAPAVLSKEAVYILGLVDGKRTVGEIFKISQGEYSNISLLNIIDSFQELTFAQLVYWADGGKLSVDQSRETQKITVWWHLTNRCNLECEYCYINKSPKRMTAEIANKAMDKIFQSAVQNDVKSIHIKFAGGEPMLEFPKIIQLIHQAKSLAEKTSTVVDFSIITNGTLITKEIAQTLKNYDIPVGISLDGLGKYHDRIRTFPNKKGSFKLVERGINHLLAKNVSFSVLAVLTSKNIDGIPELTRYFLSKNIFFTFALFRKNSEVKNDLGVGSKKLISVIEKTFELICLNPPRYNLTEIFTHFNITHPGPRMAKCFVNGDYLLVRHDGKLANCQMTIDTPIGSIDDGDVLETARKGNQVRSLGLTVDDVASCKTCQWKYACGGGCPALTLYENGRYDTVSPQCRIIKKLIPAVLRLESKRLIFHNKNNPFFLLLSQVNKIT